ncbi:MAG: S8 family serine peptidase, partial [Thermoguttaceae bacterium]|nr:S8 family serine peptidase [Thermoguttaceae bacterium]
MRAGRQHNDSTRNPRLRPLCSGCEPLEERQLLSATPWDSQPSPSDLRVEADSFHPSHVLVSFRDAPPAEFDADRLGNGNLWKVNLADGQTVDEALADLSARDDVLYALPDYQIRADYIPNDAQFGKMWGLSNTGQTGGTVDADIDAPEAWDVTRGSSSIVVAVIDTGVDYNHPDLKANMWLNADEIPGNRIDDDRNGYIDDIYGWDFANDDSNPTDDNGHGTHVAGTIAAQGNNTLGVTGVAPGVKLMALKFLDSTGSGYTSDAILALDYAVANGARISNN